MSEELTPRQWNDGEEAGWIADKVCIFGDYGQDAARVLRRQVSENAALKSRAEAAEAKLAEYENAEVVGYQEFWNKKWRGCSKACHDYNPRYPVRALIAKPENKEE